MKYILFAILLSSSSALLANESVTLRKAYLDSDRYLCFSKESVDKKSTTSVACSDFFVADSEQGKALLKQIDGIVKDETKRDLLEKYLDSRKNKTGNLSLPLTEFNELINRLDKDPKCQTAIGTIASRKSETEKQIADLEKKIKELKENTASNYQSAIVSCQINLPKPAPTGSR